MVEVRDGAPPVRQAYSDTAYSVSSVMSPRDRASNTSSTVISLARDAGGNGLSGIFDSSTVPVAASIISAWAALVSKTGAGVWATAP
ncbi:hypothetical protein D3C87_1958850 [compost metagenome]